MAIVLFYSKYCWFVRLSVHIQFLFFIFFLLLLFIFAPMSALFFYFMLCIWFFCISSLIECLDLYGCCFVVTRTEKLCVLTVWTFFCNWLNNKKYLVYLLFPNDSQNNTDTQRCTHTQTIQTIPKAHSNAYTHTHIHTVYQQTHPTFFGICHPLEWCIRLFLTDCAQWMCCTLTAIADGTISNTYVRTCICKRDHGFSFTILYRFYGK